MMASFRFAPAAALVIIAFQFAYNSVCIEVVVEKATQIANVIQDQVALRASFKIGYRTTDVACGYDYAMSRGKDGHLLHG